MKSQVTAVIAIGVLILTTNIPPIRADGTVPYTHFIEQGYVKSFDKKALTLILTDKTYTLYRSTPVYSHNGKPLSVDALHKDIWIRYNTEGNRGYTITEIIVMPMH